jgi:hypothetical protein
MILPKWLHSLLADGAIYSAAFIVCDLINSYYFNNYYSEFRLIFLIMIISLIMSSFEGALEDEHLFTKKQSIVILVVYLRTIRMLVAAFIAMAIMGKYHV